MISDFERFFWWMKSQFLKLPIPILNWSLLHILAPYNWNYLIIATMPGSVSLLKIQYSLLRTHSCWPFCKHGPPSFPLIGLYFALTVCAPILVLHSGGFHLKFYQCLWPLYCIEQPNSCPLAKAAGAGGYNWREKNVKCHEQGRFPLCMGYPSSSWALN